MHILHLTPYYAPAYAFGGVVRAVEGMARALAARGHAVTVLTTDALEPGRRFSDALDETRDGVRVVRAPNLIPRETTNLSTPFGIGRAAAPLLDSADVVHCHEFRTVENLLVTPLAAQLNKPLILSPHGTLTLDAGRGMIKSIWDALFSRTLARRFAHVVGLTRREATEAQALWTAFGATAAFSVVPNGIHPDEFAHLGGREAFRQRYGLGDAPVCLFMGRLHPRKGPHLLAQAFRQAAIPGAKLVIAGPDEGALRLIQPWVNEHVIMTGYLAGEDRLTALAAADVFALPALGGEGLPVAALEALAAGLPVILSPACNLSDVAEAGAGLEAAADVFALAEALRALLPDSDRRRRMGESARQLAARFTWDTVAEQLESLYTHSPKIFPD